MTWGIVASVGGPLLGSLISSNAAGDATDAQVSQNREAQAGIQQRFEAVQKLLAPYVDAGTKALGGQLDLLGLNGGTAQTSAIDAIANSPTFAAMKAQGEKSILANASATGGLRGGNVQSALAQFTPQLLSQLINDQYSKLGGVTSIGQNAAAGVGNAGMNSGNSIAQLLQDSGSAMAGGALAQGNAWAGGLTKSAGLLAALKGFGTPGISGDYSAMTTPDVTGVAGGFGWKGGVGGF